MSGDGASAGPLYRLVKDESREVILTANDIEGFFVGEGTDPGCVRIRGIPPRFEPSPMRIDDVELQVLDVKGDTIGAYYIGEIRVLSIREAGGGGYLEAEASFRGYSFPFPFAGEIWRCWASGPPRVRGKWRELPSSSYSSWLHVVQRAWFDAGRRAARYVVADSYVMDGSGLGNIAGVYCEIGEAVNGPGGYFGSNLDALDDCLRGAGSFELVWHSFSLSENSVGRSDVQSVVSVLRESGVRLTLNPSRQADSNGV